MGSFSRPAQLFQIKHVAVAWQRYDKLARMCMVLAKTCPALERLFVVRSKEDPFQDVSCPPALQKNLDLAFGVMNGCAMENDRGIDAGYFGAELSEYLTVRGLVPPRMHFMSQEPTGDCGGYFADCL